MLDANFLSGKTLQKENYTIEKVPTKLLHQIQQALEKKIWGLCGSSKWHFLQKILDETNIGNFALDPNSFHPKIFG